MQSSAPVTHAWALRLARSYLLQMGMIVLTLDDVALLTDFSPHIPYGLAGMAWYQNIWLKPYTHIRQGLK